MAGSQNKRKKHQDRDKYYHLAKEQGLRSRAAFKLTQINRKYPFLEQCKTAVLDLCAAPGGWTQIAARTCAPTTHIVAVDIYALRPFPKFPNITTLVGDITTPQCQADIRRAVAQKPVDVVLHDGAPHVGAEFGRDAYEQNELALHGLKCATQHLRRGGTFVTKIYRSRDYAAYHWLLQQLFDAVEVFKPKASRQQSAEIYLVALKYKAPAKLDPRLLDPKHVFEAVPGQTTGGDIAESGSASALNVLSNRDGKTKPRRQRGGYDMEFWDATMRHIVPVCDFVQTKAEPDAVKMLGQSTGLEFVCDQCRDDHRQKSAAAEAPSCVCSFLQHHPLTTPEIQGFVSDLQLLGRGDFKTLLKWREQMKESLKAQDEEDEEEDGSDEDDKEEGAKAKTETAENSDEEEAQVQEEISAMKERRRRERKREKKKERAAAAKRRRQAALGMDLNAIDLPGGANDPHSELFALSALKSPADVAKASHVDLDQATDAEVLVDSDDDVVIVGKPEAPTHDEQERLRRRERDLDEAYQLYLETTKDRPQVKKTRHAKRSKLSRRLQVQNEAIEDEKMASITASGIEHDTLRYARLLQGGNDKDDSDEDDGDKTDDDSDSDDGFYADPLTPEEHEAQKLKKQQQAADNDNPLIHKLSAPSSVQAARWFSNPLFQEIQKMALAPSGAPEDLAEEDDSSDDDEGVMADNDDDDDVEEEEEEKEEATEEKKTSRSDEPEKEKFTTAAAAAAKEGKKKQSPSSPKKKKDGTLTADDVLASIPQTEKQKRHEKRLRQMDKDARKEAKRKRLMGEEGGFEVVPGGGDSDEEEEDEKLKDMSESKRRKVLEAREQIKAGMGKALTDDTMSTNTRKKKGAASFEVVPADDDDDAAVMDRIPDRPLPVKDTRQYDSDHEQYDSDDYAETLALGTMILRRSKEKALVDASYNKYAWNDPADLPEWFVDDEKLNYRPQLPIPPALLAKMKARMMALAAKPIKKVAEARFRKHKRARAKLQAAKQKAEAVANSTEMTDAQKLKAISKALRGQEARSKPGKTYVVAKKGRALKAPGKKVKLVDKREKSDKRGAARAEKKRKHGKQGGLTGSKKRRHHS